MNKQFTGAASATAIVTALMFMAPITAQRAEAQAYGNYIPSVIHNYDTAAGIMNNTMLTEQQRKMMTDDQQLQAQTKEQKRAMKLQKRLLKHGLAKNDRNKLITTSDQDFHDDQPQ